MWESIAQQIAEAGGRPFVIRERRPVGGGCINTAYTVSDGGARWFVKLNTSDRLGMFEAEAEGLQAIAATRSVRVPVPLVWGVAEGHSYLVMEQLALGGGGGSMTRFGEQLANMHRQGRAERFGWHRDNTIGSTPQPNTQTADWMVFWREQRLGFQLALAAERGFSGRLQRLGEELVERFPGLFAGYAPVPSLLHGDLWSGNYATVAGEPVIFDPAVYHGDREADIAMTELFGGFGSEFLAAYHATWPLDPGYRVRKRLYNLYHILNHANLFGGGYAAQAESMIQQLLAELR